MFERIIRFAIEQRWLVLLAVFGHGRIGFSATRSCPSTPCPTSPMSRSRSTRSPGYSPLETEQRVTYPD
jgi:cobalt-zinc-cadmium resistance protein CzcA